MESKSQERRKAIQMAASTFGRIGGKSTAKKLGKAGMKALGEKGAAKRWGNKSINKK